MKTKHVIITLLLILSCSLSHAQVYREGDITLNAGIGLGSMSYGGVSFNAFGEYALTDAFAVGLAIGHSSYSENFGVVGFGDLYRFNATYFGPRASYHFTEAVGLDEDKFDLYGGAFLGYTVYSVHVGGELLGSVSGLGLGTDAFAYSLFGGLRYGINENFSAFGELGIGANILQVGASYRF
jgi:hypothetical protein